MTKKKVLKHWQQVTQSEVQHPGQQVEPEDDQIRRRHEAGGEADGGTQADGGAEADAYTEATL